MSDAFRELARIWQERADKMVSPAGASPSQRFANRIEKDRWAQMAEDALAVAESVDAPR
jgi:hypothetical protein